MRCCKIKTSILLACLIAGSLLLACKKPTYIQHRGLTQGTYFTIIYESPNSISYEEEINQLLLGFSASLSTYQPASLISRINQNDSTAVVDSYFRTVFDKAVEVHKASGGIFDITVAPIVNLWGFGFTGDRPDINPAKIDSLLQYVGMNKVRIEGNRVVKDLPGVMLDVNAIAKGYSVDVVADFLIAKGCHNYLVDIGGECAAAGVNSSGNIWNIAIERPKDGAAYGEAYHAYVHLNNRAIATSGNYRRFKEIDGVKYAHTIDVKTGYPTKHNLLSATIVAADCMTADAWATTCMASGLEKSIQLLAHHPELDALLIYSDKTGNYQTHATESMNYILAANGGY